MNEILNLISQYGYIIIYLLLSVELMGIPFLPGEILITYCGFLVFQGKLNFILVTATAALGAITGLTTSYFIGRKLGKPFFYKHGSKIHLGPDKMDKISNMLNKYGSALMIVVCFIPGVRHIIGYFSGTSSMKYKKFAVSSYIGAFIWAITFTFIGDTLGSEWGNFHQYISKYLIIGGIFIIIAAILFYIVKIYRKQILNFIVKVVLLLFDIFNSLGRLRIFIVITTIFLIGFADIFINIIQGLLSNEFTPFNEITAYIIKRIFNSSAIFKELFKFIDLLTLNVAYLIMAVALIIFIYYKSKDKKIEIKYTLLITIGGLIIKDGLIYLFKIINYKTKIFGEFLNGPCFTTIVIYGFLCYILLKYIKKKYIKKALVILFLLISISTGISQLFFGNDLSDILSGYSLGVVWLTLNIILLEVSKIIPDLKKEN